MKSFSPESWADGALELIAEGGLEALKVESLARLLGVTKGSFYWHFSSRSSLLRVALARWERRESEVLGADLIAITEPRARLRRLLWRGRDRIFPRLAPSVHPAAVETLIRFRERRVALLVTCYVELGLDLTSARRWALLAYAAHAGFDHLAPEDTQTATELLLPQA